MKKKLFILLIAGLATILFTVQQGAAAAKKKASGGSDNTSYQDLLAQVNELQQAQHSKDADMEKKGGRLAVGCEGTDVNGNAIICVRMKLTGFTLDIIGALELDLSKSEPTARSMADLYAGARLVKVFMDGGRFRMNVFAGGVIESIGSRSDPGGQSNIRLRAGFAPEYFLAPNFSLETTVGAEMAIMGDNADAAHPLNDARITLHTYGDNINLNAGLGFHCYF